MEPKDAAKCFTPLALTQGGYSVVELLPHYFEKRADLETLVKSPGGLNVKDVVDALKLFDERSQAHFVEQIHKADKNLYPADKLKRAGLVCNWICQDAKSIDGNHKWKGGGSSVQLPASFASSPRSLSQLLNPFHLSENLLLTYAV